MKKVSFRVQENNKEDCIKYINEHSDIEIEY